MAQRYGRKRKRAHLARIAALEEANQREKALLKNTAERLRDLEREVEEWDDEIRRQFGEYSSVRRHTPQIRSSHPIRDMVVPQPISPRFEDFSGDIAFAMTTTRQRMRRFVFDRHEDTETMRRHMRFIEVDGKGGVAYSMSEPTLNRGFGRREEEYLARTIARSMVNHWNSEAKKSR